MILISTIAGSVNVDYILDIIRAFIIWSTPLFCVDFSNGTIQLIGISLLDRIR